MTGMQVTDEVMELLRNDPARSFMIDIETDSTIAADEMEEKQRRTEFLDSVGGFMEKALPVVQEVPAMGKIASEMLLFAVRGFRTGRELESSFEELAESMGQEKKGPDVGQLMQQAEQLQMQNQELQMQNQQLQEQADANRVKAGTDIQVADRKLQAANMEAEAKRLADIEIAKIQAQADIQIAAIKEEGELGKAAQERQSTAEENANARAEIDKEIADIRAKADVEIANLMQQSEQARVQLEMGPPQPEVKLPDVVINMPSPNKTITVEKNGDTMTGRVEEDA